ncbi:baculoviral IAP repeat-containing protein 1e-like [Grammomys surdaster]|uniref:baculoviral IAP repeat-containing protein 1e-like n=1 Tax=Grammomys surdaster TaxID=491861 RepID=UPI00109FCFF3|nr:baculoviral IAP repeat-containing protein 1e-like [Grammomys surdaster]
MAKLGEASEDQVSEIDYESLTELSARLGVDAVQLAKSQEEEEHKTRMKMKKGFNSQMRSEAKRLKTFVTYDTFRSWTPQEMAAAGFYYTGVKHGVQCFCCSLILFGNSLRKLPIESHKKLRPECEFLLGKDVGNIGKYDIRVKSPETMLRGGKARYQEEEARLESFEHWPFYAHGTSPRVLSAAGFFFTGKRDTVQCFSCGECLGNWEEEDDPWKEHAKWFPNCLLIAVHTNRVRDIRPYLDTSLEIKEFPFYNTVYILKKFFSYNIICVEEFIIFFVYNTDLQGIYKTPLFVGAVCTEWLQNPPAQDDFQDVTLFKSYMRYLFLKHKATAEPLQATVSSCGQLALTGLFSSCFEFSSDDLAEAGVDEDEELTTYLMSKFTAQRLRPVYRFLSPLLQEFLAAMRLTELLGSDRQEDQELGLYYLRQINSPLKAINSYNVFLKYVSSYSSSKVGPPVASHLLRLMDEKDLLENMSENEEYMKLHPETLLWWQFVRGLWLESPESFSSFISEHLLSIALNFAYESNTVAACSPFILQFLRGRTLALRVLNLQYFEDHPNSLLLLRSLKVRINGNKMSSHVDYSFKTYFENLQPPAIDEEYTSAFEHISEWKRNFTKDEEIIKHYVNIRPRALPDISEGYWKLTPKPSKIPRLEVGVVNMGPADQALLQVLMEVFSASENIEFHLLNSSGFLESIRPALELNKTSVTKCSMSRMELSRTEQELLLSLPALQSLEVSGTNQLPDQLFPNLDKFLGLKELCVRLDGKQDVLSVLPGEFPNLHHIEKLSIQTSTESDLSKLVKLIQNSPNLHVFHLKCDFLSNCESLMAVLASCKKLREIEFSGRCFEAMSFVTILPNFVSLGMLNLKGQQFPDKETSEKFAQALGSLRNLEELLLPTGDGIHQVAKLIVQQCLQLPCLRVFAFHYVLDDDSVIEIARVATRGGFQKLESLDLSMNHKITEEGYKNFFQALDNLPNLKELNICRRISECIQVQATTVKALGQCVSRLPSLTRLGMLSWLLDEEDMKVINDVKERHPQSKRLLIFWKWIVPFSPVVLE